MGPVSYIKNVWNVIQLWITALGIASIVIYIYREIEARNVFKDLTLQSQGQF